MDYQDTILCPSSEALAQHGLTSMDRLIASDPEVHTDWAQLALQEADDKEASPVPAREGDDHLGLQIGRYELIRCLGAGGRGTIYLARDPLLQREVALKTVSLTGTLPERRAQAQAFWQEARAVSGLSHPHIVTVFDAGAQDHQCYLVMERLLGKDLRDLLASGWRPEIREALQVGRRIADALGYAHAKGVIHRDIKPGNIFMVGRTQPRILDFGIARRTGAGQTQSGAASTDNEIAVSPFYAAPELLQGGPVDSRADVFSVGVLLYELLTGQRPFQGRDLKQITEAVCADHPLPPHHVRPELHPEISEWIMGALQKRPDDRLRSARLLGQGLRRCLQLQDERAKAEGAGRPLPASTPSGSLGERVSNNSQSSAASTTDNTGPLRRPRWFMR